MSEHNPFAAPPSDAPSQPGVPGWDAPGWGAPVPPKKSRKVLWTVLGTLGGMALLGGGAVAYVVAEVASKTGNHRIALPGDFHGMRRDDDAPTARKLSASTNAAAGSRTWTPTSAFYRDSGSHRALMAWGGWGDLLFPGQSQDSVFKHIGATDRRGFDPGPLGGRLDCAHRNSGSGEAFCVWADGSSLVTVREFDGGPETDLDRLAADTRELRQLAEVKK